ncbi:STAS domain-containing protein [Flavobacterium tiangeerense]|uniref:STAS domain-containing protein n=1 Tax=Flavobacterium tiangeerense TaxID=459471 RepID=UPI0011A3C3BD|nr:STAS domain-containing protein [Flavobacterium tiangeerense]
MAVHITYNSGVYEIKGLLSSENSVYLENHLNSLLSTSNGIVVSFEKVEAMDAYTTRNILAIYDKAQKDDKSFFIIGRKNKCISACFDALGSTDVLL